jgi:uncharacterized membrane protein
MVHAIQNKKEMIMNKILAKAVWLIILLPVVYLAIAWNTLPEKIAMRYDLHGNVEKFGSRKELLGLAAILTAMNIFVYFLLTNMYRIDPKKHAVENKDRLQRIAFAVTVFISAILCLIIYSSKNASLRFNIAWVFSGVGLLFAVIGNYMPNLKPNYFAGFRLPWTLENENNWRKTHLLAGKLWFAGGLLLTAICLFLPPVAAIVVFFSIMLFITIIPMVYSYRLYKKQKSG